MILATVSHEMRTPINAILHQLDSLEHLLQKKDTQGKSVQKMIKIIKNSA